MLQADPQPPAAGSSGRYDVTYPLEVDLAAGESTDLEIGLGFQESGCGAATESVRGWPSLTFQVLGLTHERAAANTLAWVQDGPSIECPHRRDWAGR